MKILTIDLSVIDSDILVLVLTLAKEAGYDKISDNQMTEYYIYDAIEKFKFRSYEDEGWPVF